LRAKGKTSNVATVNVAVGFLAPGAYSETLAYVPTPDAV
jgi:hypothetical protein